MNAVCPKCGEPVSTALLKGNQLVLLSPESRTDGTVLAIDGRATFLDGPLLVEARRRNMPLYTRHGVTCRGFWITL
jgi:hypothetical protein